MKTSLNLILLFSIGLLISCKKDKDPVGLPVETVAGTGEAGATDGPLATATFNRPNGLALDAAGNIYVSDRENHKIRKITPGGMVSTLAGTGVAGYKDGIGTEAQFHIPGAIAMDANNNLYVADWLTHRIRMITPGGVVSTYAGSGPGYLEGPKSTAKFNTPKGLGRDAAGNFYVVDQDNQRIRKISTSGEVTTLAGTGMAGYQDGDGATAQFNKPRNLALDASGNIYVADADNNRIRKITPAGVVSTFAGGSKGFTDGTGTAAKFDSPKGVAVDKNNNVYVADQGNHAIRKITPSGVVTTIAGDGKAGSNERTDSEPARFNGPRALAVDVNSTFLYIADQGNNMIRKIAL
jgi:sugar lactone lactonase YvrE